MTLAARARRRGAVYHAGLDRERRAAVQRAFMAGDARVVVATNAFGMGVDKADVRTVCHETVPQSLEAYYQEAGRAGRDGAPARCLLFAEARDKGLHVFFIERARSRTRPSRAVARAAARQAAERRAATTSSCASWRRRRRCEDATRRARSSATRARRHDAAGAVAAGPRRRADRRRVGRRALPHCRASAGRPRACAGASTARSGRSSSSAACRRGAMLRHFGDRSAPERTGVACCDVCDPGCGRAGAVRRGRTARGGAAAGGAAASTRRSTTRSSRSSRRREPAVGRTRAVEILRGGRSKAIAEVLLRRLPRTARSPPARRGRAARVDTLLAAGRLRSTGGALPEAARGRGRRRGVTTEARCASACSPPGRAPTCRRSSTRVHGRGGDRGRGGWLRRRGARHWSGARRAGVPAPPSRSPSTPTASRATRRSPTGSSEPRRRLVVLAGYMQLLRGFLARFPARSSTSTRAAAGVPGARRGRAGAGARGARYSG